MNVTPKQQQALITYLSRRLPDWDQRAEVARRAILPQAQFAGDPRTGWSTLISEALDQERLPHLLRAAAALKPDDLELTQLALEATDGELVVPFNLPDRRMLIGGAVLVALLGCGGVLYLGSGSPEAVPSTPVVEASAGAPVAKASVPPAPADKGAVVAPPESPEEQGAAAEEQSAAAEEGTPAAQRTAPSQAAARTSAEPLSAAQPSEPARSKEQPTPAAAHPKTAKPVTSAGPHCARPVGQIVGYAYYAMEPPRFTDGVWRLGRALNVRQQYPSKENNWSTSSPVVCVLEAGSTLTLKAEPVRVAGGAWWIPVVGGEVTPPN